jgi:hypothetical protein
MARAVEEYNAQHSYPLLLLDTAAISSARVDAHIKRSPKHYGRFSEFSGGYACTHWCLPGIPDLWNLETMRLLQKTER